MDNLKVYLAKLKKHHFWVLVGVVLIVGQATYLKAKWGLEKTYKENKSSIEAAVMRLRGVETPQQANETYEKEINKEQEKMEAQSFGIWQKCWETQLPKLNWPAQPKEVAEIELRDRDPAAFRDAPWEPVTSWGWTEIPSQVREFFMNNSVQPQWQKMLESVDLRRAKKGAGGAEPAPAAGLAGIGAVADKNVEFEGIVSWDQKDRDALMDRIKFKKTPSTIRVRVSQEDFWVYTALTDVVKAMNEGANDVLAASVKRIDRMEIAQWAIKYAQDNPGPDLGIRESEDGSGMLGQSDGRITPPEADKDISDEAILDNRYVDQNNRPVSAKALMNKTLDPSLPKPPFAEFRQMFVVMKLVMDQRKVPDLLAACANSSLPIEVRQVMAHFADPLEPKDAQLAAANAGVPKADRGPFDAMVEVRGIVYLYNQPDKTKLGAGAAQNPARRSLGIPDKSLPPDAALQPVGQ